MFVGVITNWLAEWCADLFGGTARSLRGRIAITVVAVLLIGSCVAVTIARYESLGILLASLVVPFALVGARRVFVARDELWRAATLPLDHPRQAPKPFDDESLPRTALALSCLARSVDAARRNRLVEASELVAKANGALLRPEEIGLYAAVCAIVSLGVGHDAAGIAMRALPCGSDELDAILGHAVLRDAWRSETRVAAIDSAWSTSGVDADGDGTLPRLRRLIRVRVDGVDALPPDEARALAAEAEAIGDGDLSAELSARGRGSRMYR